MNFQLSAFGPYRSAIFAKQSGDFATARIEFEKCINAARAAGGPPAISGLLFQLGDVESQDGKRELALQRYEEALAADPDSPLGLICFAESLLLHLNEPSLAMKRVLAAEALLVSGCWHESEEDLTREQYMQRIAEVRSKITAANRESLPRCE